MNGLLARIPRGMDKTTRGPRSLPVATLAVESNNRQTGWGGLSAVYEPSSKLGVLSRKGTPRRRKGLSSK